MEILLLSAYHAPSHRRWVEGVAANLTDHSVKILSQPPRHFAWRSRGNSLFWAFDEKLAESRPDLIIATSMVDLAGLRGMVPHLTQIPTLLYFHENQFAYPNRGQRNDGNYGVTNLYSALAADRVLFNSPYNRRSFLEGARQFLSKMPDQIPAGVAQAVAAKSGVLPVPLANSLADPYPSRPDEGPLRIVWNHRWEYDKAPATFFSALERLEKRHDFRLVVMGQRFRKAPPVFARMQDRLASRIDQWGYVEDRRDYLKWLERSDLVVSTALHEFQGLAVQEAVMRGCLPVLPDRLAYPDFFDDSCLYDSHPEDDEADADALAAHLDRLLADPKRTRELTRPDLSHLRWSVLAGDYEREITELVCRHRPHRDNVACEELTTN